MDRTNKLIGSHLVGGNPLSGRMELDYYAANPKAVNMLLENEAFNGKHILEPCVGAGHIANVLKDYFGEEVTGIDIIDRGYVGTIVTDFLNWIPDKKYDTIITNPPYSLAAEFIEKCISILLPYGKLAMFLRINFLETVKRKELFDKYPPKYVYVFRKRMPVFNNGEEINPKTGKAWNTLLCNAWYVWQKGCYSEPIIRWI